MSVEVLTFDDRYASAFAELNYAWIEKYFTVEPEDTKALSNPKRYAIDGGGEIFFACVDGVPVGTVAMVRKSGKLYELAKMAVDERFQRRGLAEQLMKCCIDFARAREATQITLTTNSILTPAVTLYRRFGFEAQEANLDTRYVRGDLQMVLELS